MKHVTLRSLPQKLPKGDEIIFENPQRISASAHKPHSFYASIFVIAVAMVMLKVLASIVWEYRYYFPPNFEAAFLIGREKIFVGIYRMAFYAHIVAGPVVVILSVGLLLTGGRSRFRKFHRWVGRSLVLIVSVAIVPSGFVIFQAFHTRRWDQFRGTPPTRRGRGQYQRYIAQVR